ncbi:MAG: hypothetical protein WC166_06415 [Bacteroidales bacterium]
MAKKIKVLISNGKVNSYGFRVLTSGIDIEQYRKNPILLWMHHRPLGGSKDEVLPLGVVEDLELAGDALYGTPVILANDEFSKGILERWENGTLKMVSPRFDDVEFSSEKEYLAPGQRGETVIKCKLTEVSIVDIGANDDALQLYKDGENITLTLAGKKSQIPLINKTSMDLTKIALALGLNEDATREEILAQIALCMQAQEQVGTLQTENDSIKLSAITGIVNQAVQDKRIKEDRKDHFVALGKQIGVEMLSKTLSACAQAVDVKPMEVIRQSSNRKLTYSKLSEVPEDEIMLLREQNTDEYKRLYKAEYGIECQF